MLQWLHDLILRRRKIEDIVKDELYETRLKLLEFQKAVEHDTNMLRMYQERYNRLNVLRKDMDSQPKEHRK